MSDRTTPDPRPKLSVRRFCLVVTAGPDKGAEHASDGREVVIGTQKPAELLLTDPKVSRLHCEIALHEGRAIVRDEGSTNGTSVDGVVVHVAELRDGQTLALGDTRVRFELAQDR